MSTRSHNGTHYDNHHREAELHDAAAHAHFTASGHGQEDHLTAHEQSRQALEHAHEAQRNAEKAPAVHRVAGSEHHDAVSTRAFAIWRARGCPEGSPEQDWYQAVKEHGHT